MPGRYEVSLFLLRPPLDESSLPNNFININDIRIGEEVLNTVEFSLREMIELRVYTYELLTNIKYKTLTIHRARTEFKIQFLQSEMSFVTH